MFKPKLILFTQLTSCTRASVCLCLRNSTPKQRYDHQLKEPITVKFLENLVFSGNSQSDSQRFSLCTAALGLPPFPSKDLVVQR